MKKILYILALAAAFSSCNNTIEDVYKQLPNEPLNKTTSYTLTAADYSDIIKAAAADTAGVATPAEKALLEAAKATQSLNDYINPNKFIPAVMAKAFPALNKNSAVKVSFSFTGEYLATLAAAPTHTLTADDYHLVYGSDSDTDFLTPSNKPSVKIPEILLADYPTAVAGDVKVVSYKIADQDAGPSPTRLFEDFSAYDAPGQNAHWNLNGWTEITTVGTKFASVRVYSGVKYGFVSANYAPLETTEIYVISPLVDLTRTTNNQFSFDLLVGNWNFDCLQILITEDASCITNPTGVTWSNVTSAFTIPQTPTSGYAPNFTPAGTLNLDTNFAGKKIYIAFKYNSVWDGAGQPTNQSTAYEINNILVKGTAPGGGGEVAKRTENAIYTFDGTKWVAYANATVLNPADYTAMGVSTMNYATAIYNLPEILHTRFPFAKEGDKQAVLYKSSATANTALEFVCKNHVWQIALRTAQFVNDGEKWLFDPSVNYTMLKADYQTMCDYVLNHPTLNVYFRMNTTTNVPYDNEEWYYGFSGYYGNVNFRLSGSPTSSREVPSSVANDTALHALSSPEAKNAFLWERLTKDGMMIFLQKKFPDTDVEAQGVQLYYNITVKFFYPDGVTNETIDYRLKYKVLTAGAPDVLPTFEFISSERL